jgi:hypothetical protein
MRGRVPGRIRIMFDLTEEDRRAIAQHYGKAKPVTLTEARSFLSSAAYGVLEDVLFEYRRDRPHAFVQRGPGMLSCAQCGEEPVHENHRGFRTSDLSQQGEKVTA